MTYHATTLKARDHLAAMLASIVSAQALGLFGRAGFLPDGMLALDWLSGQAVGMALCGLVYVLSVQWLYRRRLVKGPLYRCGESRPAEDFGKSFEPGPVRLLDSWQYR